MPGRRHLLPLPTPPSSSASGAGWPTYELRRPPYPRWGGRDGHWKGGAQTTEGEREGGREKRGDGVETLSSLARSLAPSLPLLLSLPLPLPTPPVTSLVPRLCPCLSVCRVMGLKVDRRWKAERRVKRSGLSSAPGMPVQGSLRILAFACFASSRQGQIARPGAPRAAEPFRPLRKFAFACFASTILIYFNIEHMMFVSQDHTH